MDLNARFEEIISTLSKGHRYLKPLDENQREFLVKQLDAKSEQEELKKTFCIIENTCDHCAEFETPLIHLLKEIEHKELLIHALNGARRHIITRRQKEGKRLEGNFLVALEKLLEHSDPEVLEWTLRTIDECGGQGIYFKSKLQKVLPSLFSIFFNKHKKNTHEIMTMLEKRWEGQS